MRFKKRPIEVSAARWWVNGDHPGDGPRELEGVVVRYFRSPDLPGHTSCRQCGATMHVHGWIDTLEGGHIVCPGDWIVTGVQGERYPVKPDIFAATFVTAADGTLRRFVLVRDVDVTGVSGEGVVVWGVSWPDGHVSYRWNTDTATTSSADCIDDVIAIHGHNGATKLVWLDGVEEGMAWLTEDSRAAWLAKESRGGSAA